MNETDLIAFIQWLPTKIEAFQNKTPEEIAQVLNNMSKTEEGKAELEALIGEFKESNIETNMFKKGGRLDYLVEKFKKGGIKKADRRTIKAGKKSDKFNRTAYRNMKAALRDQDLGLGRTELKAIAMKNILGGPAESIQDKLNSLEISPIVPNNLAKVGAIAMLDRAIAPKAATQTSPDFSGNSFSKAFAEARKQGLSTFKWNGKLYGTKLATSTKAAKNPTLPPLPNSQLSNSQDVLEITKRGLEAAKGVRPENMDEEKIVDDPYYSDYVFMTNLWNPKRFDSRYVGPKNLNFLEKGGTLTNKFEKGGKQRKSDQFRKEFHGVDLFPYGPGSRRHKGYVYDAESLPSGIKTGILPNGVGIRQITNKNITTTELVSPDKRDSLYLHNGVAGRVDSNINDAGFLGYLGLKESTPVSDRYKELQKKFNSRFSKEK